MNRLVNKKIKEVLLSDDKTNITFVDINNNKYSYVTIGDCCSSSYFDSIEGLDSLLNHTILKVEHSNGNFFEKETAGELNQFYGVNIKTDKGLFEMIYRNDSNGYYGGSLEPSDDTHATTELKNDFIGEDYIGTEYAKKRMYKDLLKDTKEK